MHCSPANPWLGHLLCPETLGSMPLTPTLLAHREEEAGWGQGARGQESERPRAHPGREGKGAF